MMKTFADFIAEAKKSKSDYSKVYAAKVSDARERQQNRVNSYKEKTKNTGTTRSREQKERRRKRESRIH